MEKIEIKKEKYPIKFKAIKDNLVEATEWEEREVGLSCSLIDKINEIVEWINNHKDQLLD